MVSEQMKPSVLLVDDVQSFRETLSLEFEERGYRVFQAATAAEALATGADREQADNEKKLKEIREKINANKNQAVSTRSHTSDARQLL